jgi:hypothetical protein
MKKNQFLLITSILLLTMLMIITGCTKNEGTTSKAAEVPQQVQKSKAPSLDEVQTFLKKWSELQSNKDVSGYLALYATEFTGIKRTTSGKTTNYNFQEWAQDRGKMYEKAKSLSVVAEDVKVTATDETAGVTTFEFMQYYTSEKYCDKGRKVIKIKRDGNDLKIIHEELLFSQKNVNETVKDKQTVVTGIGGYSESGDSLTFYTRHGEFYIYTAGGTQNMDKADLLEKSMKNGTPVVITAESGLVSEVKAGK